MQAVPNFSCVSEYLVGSEGRIDFVVWPPEKFEKWGLELLLNSDKIDEHLSRFSQPLGKYAPAACSSSLVIDCRTSPVTSNPTNNDVMTIAPHLTRGWDVITTYVPAPVVGAPVRHDIPRDCVPRWLNTANSGRLEAAVMIDKTVKSEDVSSVPPSVKACWVSVKLPGQSSPISTTNVATTLDKGNMNVDGLKTAVLTHPLLVMAMQAGNYSTITVFAPGTEKGAEITDGWTELKETTGNKPYHVVLT